MGQQGCERNLPIHTRAVVGKDVARALRVDVQVTLTRAESGHGGGHRPPRARAPTPAEPALSAQVARRVEAAQGGVCGRAGSGRVALDEQRASGEGRLRQQVQLAPEDGAWALRLRQRAEVEDEDLLQRAVRRLEGGVGGEAGRSVRARALHGIGGGIGGQRRREDGVQLFSDGGGVDRR